MTKQKKRLGGFSKIHIAKLNEDGTYVTPISITGAKSIEAELNYETVKFYSDNSPDFSVFFS